MSLNHLRIGDELIYCEVESVVTSLNRHHSVEVYPVTGGPCGGAISFLVIEGVGRIVRYDDAASEPARLEV